MSTNVCWCETIREFCLTFTSLSFIYVLRTLTVKRLFVSSEEMPYICGGVFLGKKMELPILGSIINLDWVHFVGEELVLAAYCCGFLFCWFWLFNSF